MQPDDYGDELLIRLEAERLVRELGMTGLAALIGMNGIGLLVAVKSASDAAGAWTYLAGLSAAMLALTVSYLLAQLRFSPAVQRMPPTAILAAQLGPALASFAGFLAGAAQTIATLT